MKKNLILEVIAPDDGQTESWCHLAPYGEFDYTDKSPDGTATPRRQKLDRQAFDLIVAAFEPEVLIDREHLSIVADDTTAQGWIQELEIRGDGFRFEDGLWCRVKWTDVGLDNLKNRRLRWLSPVWPPITREDNRPEELESAGLTNGARFRKKLTPVVNKVDNQNNNPDTPEGGKDKNMDKTILEMLGLDENATPEDVQAAVKALKESAAQAEELTNKVEELEKSNLETEADKVADDNEDKIANKDDFVKLYVANKEMALKVLGCIKAAGGRDDAVCNKADAKPPASFIGKASGGGQVLNKLEQYNAMPEGPDKVAYLRNNAVEINDLAVKAGAE